MTASGFALIIRLRCRGLTPLSAFASSICGRNRFSRAHIRTKLSSRGAGPGSRTRPTECSRGDTLTGSARRHCTNCRPGRRGRNRNQGRRSRSPFPSDKSLHTSPSTTQRHSHAHPSDSRDSAACFPQLLSYRNCWRSKHYTSPVSDVSPVCRNRNYRNYNTVRHTKTDHWRRLGQSIPTPLLSAIDTHPH